MNYELSNEIKRLRCARVLGASKRSEWLHKHKVFAEMRNNVHF